jgi:hypothetical protein
MSADPTATVPIDPRPAAAGGRWLPVLAVIAVIALIAGGGQLVGRATDGASAPQLVGGAVRVRPLPGWAAAEPRGAPLPELVLTRGSVTLHVLAVPGWRGTAEDLARTYFDRTLRPRFDELEIGQASTGTLASGVPAIRFGYVGVAEGVPIEGAVTVATGATAGAIFDASAPKGDLAWVASDVDAMIQDAEVA